MLSLYKCKECGMPYGTNIRLMGIGSDCLYCPACGADLRTQYKSLAHFPSVTLEEWVKEYYPEMTAEQWRDLAIKCRDEKIDFFKKYEYEKE